LLKKQSPFNAGAPQGTVKPIEPTLQEPPAEPGVYYKSGVDWIRLAPPSGRAEMLRFWAGSANATNILYSGAMYTAEEAKSLGLVHEVAPEENYMVVARKAASDLASKSLPAFASIKSLLRSPIADEMLRRERESIREFTDIWYSEATWANLQNIRIH
jgi:Enoyl-CoA hydratase/isomerase